MSQSEEQERGTAAKTPTGVREFWMAPDQWPASRLDDYVFLIDALNRLGRKRHANWDRLPGYFRQRDSRGLGLPERKDIATQEDRWLAHQALCRTNPVYVPEFRGAFEWNTESDGFEENGDPEFHFSDSDWQEAIEILNSGILLDQTEIQMFEGVVNELANAAANGKLRTYRRPANRGDYVLIPESRWDIDLLSLLPRFAFGRAADFDSSESTHLIFVSTVDLEHLANPVAKSGVAPAKNNIKQICIKWLIQLRLSGPQQAAKEKYCEAFQKHHPDVIPSRFTDWWNESQKEAAREFEKRLAAWTPINGASKPVAHVWGKRGPRDSTMPIEFKPI